VVSSGGKSDNTTKEIKRLEKLQGDLRRASGRLEGGLLEGGFKGT